MGFWDSASKGYDEGYALGVRKRERKEDRDLHTKERAEDQATHKAERKEDVEYRKADQGLRIKQGEREQSEFDVKEATRKAKTTLNVAKAQIANDNRFEAASTLQKYYNEQIPNGDEIRIIQRDINPENPIFKEVPKGKNIVVQSKSGGLKFFGSLDEVLETAAGMANVESISQGYEHSRQAVALENSKAAQNPVLAQDGKRYINTFKMGPGGVPVLDKQVEYTGKAPMGGIKAGLMENLGRAPSDSELRTSLGLREKEKTADPPSVKGSKESVELQNKELEGYKKKLDLALRPFTKSAKSTFDWSTGQMTSEGGNAIESIDKLIEKAASEEPLTAAEKKQLPQAKQARKLYDSIFTAVAGGEQPKPEGTPPVEGAQQAADGNWYVKKNGKYYLVESN